MGDKKKGGREVLPRAAFAAECFIARRKLEREHCAQDLASSAAQQTQDVGGCAISSQVVAWGPCLIKCASRLASLRAEDRTDPDSPRILIRQTQYSWSRSTYCTLRQVEPSTSREEDAAEWGNSRGFNRRPPLRGTWPGLAGDH